METKKLIPIGGLFKKSWDFYKQRLYLIISLAMILFANYVIVSLLLDLIGRGPNNGSFVAGIGLLTLVFFLFTLIINFWVQIALFYAIKEKDITRDVKSLLVFSWGQVAPYSWVAVLVGVITIIGFIFFIIPGIIFLVWYSLSTYVFVFEDLKGMKALERSRQLVKGYWWPVLGRLFLFGLITAVIGSIPVIGDIVNIFFMAPLGIIYIYFIYEDLKTLKA